MTCGMLRPRYLRWMGSRALASRAAAVRPGQKISICFKADMLRRSTEHRHLFTRARAKLRKYPRLEQAWREQPFMLSFGFFCVFLSFIYLALVNVYAFAYLTEYHTYPEEVAKPLKRAVYFDKEGGKDPQKALRYYNDALLAASEIGLNPFDERVQGIRIRIAECLERYDHIEQAIGFLEMERDQCYIWVEKSGGRHQATGHRSRVLAMAVKLGVKIAQLYSSDYIDKPKKAQQALVQAVETMLREQMRREEEGVQDGEGNWMNPEEIGSSMEELGHTYLDATQPELALPLFVEALSLCKQNACHSAMLMNSISAALSVHNPSAELPTKLHSSGLPLSLHNTSDLQGLARQWAEQALQTANSVQHPDRTEECDMACAVTTYNLAELLEMSGDRTMAKKLFGEARSLAQAINFDAGVAKAADALRRLEVG